jgi:hypothetical protein
MTPPRSILVPGLLAVDQIGQCIASRSHHERESECGPIDIADGTAAFSIITLSLIIHVIPHL